MFTTFFIALLFAFIVMMPKSKSQVEKQAEEYRKKTLERLTKND